MEFKRNGRNARAEFFYPRNEDQVCELEVDLCDTRAADGIRIRYDFDRDGWAISQASTFVWSADDNEMDDDWQEVAFIRAWAREAVTEFHSEDEAEQIRRFQADLAEEIDDS